MKIFNLFILTGCSDRKFWYRSHEDGWYSKTKNFEKKCLGDDRASIYNSVALSHVHMESDDVSSGRIERLYEDISRASTVGNTKFLVHTGYTFKEPH